MALSFSPRRGRPGRNALYTAAEKGRTRLVSLLLTLGRQDADRADSYGITPLQIAAWNNHCEVVQRLCQFNVDVNAPDKTGHTALFKAVWNGCAGCVENLLQAGAYCDVADDYDNTPLMLAAELSYVQISRCLVRAGAPLDFRNRRGETALYHAAASGRLPCVQLLLAMGANPNLADTDGCTPLFCCISCFSGDCTLISIFFLMRANADLDLRGRSHDVSDLRPLSPFELALHLRRPQAARLLALAGCDVTRVHAWLRSNQVPPSIQGDDAMLDFLHDLCGQPRSLKQFCRKVIRCHSHVRNLSHTHLPKTLQEYLNYSDLEAELAAATQ